MSTPPAARAAAIRRAPSGAIVLWSTTVAPRRAPCTIPCSPSVTSSTAFVSVTIVSVMSLRAATSAGDAAPWAPAATSGAMTSGRRAQTRTACPCLNRFLTIGAPIAPSPTNPSLDIRPTILLFRGCETASKTAAARRSRDRSYHGAENDFDPRAWARHRTRRRGVSQCTRLSNGSQSPLVSSSPRLFRQKRASSR